MEHAHDPASVEKELPNSKYRRAFAVARRSAAQVLRHRFRLIFLVQNAYKKMFKEEDALRQIRTDLATLLRLAWAWAGRRYRDISWQSIVYVVGGIIYFLSPIDLIPDAIPGIGFVDDIAVVSAVVRALRADLEQFRAWEEAQGGATDELAHLRPEGANGHELPPRS